jgi:hypothetical protein
VSGVRCPVSGVRDTISSLLVPEQSTGTRFGIFQPEGVINDLENGIIEEV